MSHYRYQTRLFVSFIPTCWMILLLLLLSSNIGWMTCRSIPNNNNNPQHSFDPYSVLGFKRHDYDRSSLTSKDIQQRYHQLCLRYHPDKHHQYDGSNKQEKQLLEEKFKQICQAYELIGTDHARHKYHVLSQFHSSIAPFYQNHNNNNINNQQPSDLFPSSINHTVFTTLLQQLLSTSFQSIYVYKVYVPLPDLYRGVPQYHIHIVPPLLSSSSSQPQQQHMKRSHTPKKYHHHPLDHVSHIITNHNFFYWIWKRYRASFRGGIGFLKLYESILYMLPFYRFISKSVALFIACYIFDRSIPNIYYHDHDHDDHLSYHITILPGYKGGTKFTFPYKEKKKNNKKNPIDYHDHPPCRIYIVFQLCEAYHERYQRIGNHLHTSIIITSQQAKDGCQVDIPSLVSSSYSNSRDHDHDNHSEETKEHDDHDPMIHISIPSNIKSGEQIRIPQYGWPIRNRTTTNHETKKKTKKKKNQPIKYGDLVVTVYISNHPNLMQWKQRLLSIIQWKT
jgi:DnaJ-class molecular chaperone